MKIGILALQGAFHRHAEAVDRLGAAPIEVRTPAALDGVDGLIIPGGESTTISMLLDSSGLFDPIAERIGNALPVLGTCAGMILSAADILDGRPDQRCFGAIDIDVRRNAFGRQRDSFEADLEIEDVADGPFHAVFIRAPIVERAGAEVDVLATVEGRPVVCRQGVVLVSAFHPELSDDLRLHQLFLEGC